MSGGSERKLRCGHGLPPHRAVVSGERTSSESGEPRGPVLRPRRIMGASTASVSEERTVGPDPATRVGGVDTPRRPPVVARQALFGLLSAGGPGGVTLLSAPAGSGKTVLLRSWIGHASLGDRVAWVAVERDTRDAQRFWLAVVGALRAA